MIMSIVTFVSLMLAVVASIQLVRTDDQLRLARAELSTRYTITLDFVSALGDILDSTDLSETQRVDMVIQETDRWRTRDAEQDAWYMEDDNES